MNLYLAGSMSTTIPEIRDAIKTQHPFILQSFATIDSSTTKLIPQMGDFLLDSGAFTFFSNCKKKMNWEKYIDDYANFIKENRVTKFFELDIDSILGLERVEELRRTLEKKVGRPCIPVWHKSRGRKYFERMCREYPYISIGGIVSKEISRDEYRYFPWFIREAHRNGAKIHGLGFTSQEGIRKYHFDSVDSTSWLSGCRFGGLDLFDGRKIVRITKEGRMMKDLNRVRVHNFKEWIKYQSYVRDSL